MDSECHRHIRGCAGPSTESLRHTLLIAGADSTGLLCAGERPGVRAFSLLSSAGIPPELPSMEGFVDFHPSDRTRYTAVDPVRRDGPRKDGALSQPSNATNTASSFLFCCRDL